jgi:hypothetical protein
VDPATPLITVNGRVITLSEFEGELVAVVRNRFYHRAPPDGEIELVRRDVAQKLVTRVLAAAEAKRRGLAPDEAKVARDLERIEARFRNSPGWAEHRGPQVARWRADLEEQSLAEVLEKEVREGVAPTPEQVRKFYDDNPALFTEPEKVRISIILLRVDPSAGKAARDKAREEAASIRQRLAKGADFAELARIHSAEESAAKGGDVGFAHRGSLTGPVQEAVDKLAVGQVSEPLEILEGVAIVQVTGREPSQLRPYDAVTERAQVLLRRKGADEAWTAVVEGLRAAAKVEVDARFYPELAAVSSAAKAGAPAAQ